jgi:hypothetical protein
LATLRVPSSGVVFICKAPRKFKPQVVIDFAVIESEYGSADVRLSMNKEGNIKYRIGGRGSVRVGAGC